MILGINGIIAGRGADADALAFITAANITDTTQKNAVNQLVTDLKSANIWTKMKAIYPFVGGTASSHKFNLKDPRDLDAAFRLVFSGGWTHSSTGALPNGTTGYADTKFNPNLNLNINSSHLSYYSRNNKTSAYDIGSNDGTYGLSMIINYTFTALSGFLGMINSGTNIRNSLISNSLGLYQVNRLSSTTASLIRNGVITNYTNSSTGKSNINIFIGALNYISSPTDYSSHQAAFASIGDGLTDAEATAFYNVVQAYQTTLGRQV